MRICVLANKDIASNLAINALIKALPDHQLRVFLSSSVGSPDTGPDARRHLAFFEQTLFNDIVFPAAHVSAPHSSPDLLSFDSLDKAGIKVCDIADINSEQGLQMIAASKPHLMLSIRFGQILRPTVIQIPEFGVLNLHSGILPQYRGVMATFWAMLNGEQQIGTTLHYIQDAGIDTGDVIAVNTQSTDYTQSYLWNVLALYEAGIESMVNAVNRIAKAHSCPTHLQDHDQGKYYGFPEKSDFQRFCDQGLSLYHFSDLVSLARRYR